MNDSTNGAEAQCCVEPKTSTEAQPEGMKLPEEKQGSNSDEDAANSEREVQADLPNQKDLLLKVAETVPLWHDPRLEAYATIKDKHSLDNCSIRSKRFKEWLCFKVYDEYNCTPGSQPVEDVLRILAGKAKYKGAEFETRIRIGGDANISYLHLADAAGTVIQISAAGVSDA